MVHFLWTTQNRCGGHSANQQFRTRALVPEMNSNGCFVADTEASYIAGVSSFGEGQEPRRLPVLLIIQTDTI